MRSNGAGRMERKQLSMQYEWSPNRSRPGLGRFFLGVLLLLTARAGAVWILRSISRPQGAALYFYGVDALAIILVSTPVLLWKPPRAAVLGLAWRRVPVWEQRLYAIGAVALAGHITATAIIDYRILTGHVHALLIVPFFEEILFRGYGWSYISARVNRGSGDPAAWIVLAIFSAAWRYGCYQSGILPTSFPGLVEHPIWLAAVKGLALGLLAGLARWQTGRVFGPILIHAFFNLIAGI